MRKTKVLCTIGPSCDSPESLKDLMQAGMNIARLNMAHGDYDYHSGIIKNISKVSKELNVIVPILLDVKGPEVRTGKLKEDKYELIKDEYIILTTEQIIGDANRISITYDELPSLVSKGSRILIDDGLIGLEVVDVQDTEINCKIINSGTLKSRKGVNLPNIKTNLPGVTDRDIEHIIFGIEQGIDIIAVSFVRKAKDINQVRDFLKQRKAEHIQIISKIENEEGVSNIEEILEASDGIMVARGDLGVEIPVEEVPLVQKRIIELCHTAGKPVIIATHMLDSMQINPRPTRAEVTDVSTAVLQGADILMLSGETASGKYPMESVQTMVTVANKLESVIDYRELFNRNKSAQNRDVTEIISQSVVSSALELNAKAILVSTESGFTARMLSKYRPISPIIAITEHDHVLKKLCLLWGVIPVKCNKLNSTDEMLETVIEKSSQVIELTSGDYVVISAGVPLGQAGTTNLIKIQQV